MAKRGRGVEGMVRCEKCGRLTRRDKAVTIEKVILTNPLERKDVHDESYTRNFVKEVTYCVSCGKHGRIFEKKKKMQERQRERDALNADRPVRKHSMDFSAMYAGSQRPPAETIAKPVEEKPAEQPGDDAAADEMEGKTEQ
ncbi:hypothetical protein AUJ14_05190 [Candidatus Micrarchaeota archaeon CG1_02_55_22]|nr:MAG: hypothetical protein AUJ14_05190 [Candidatus Micrarchaeota archaeon CG1_02_55_22]